MMRRYVSYVVLIACVGLLSCSKGSTGSSGSSGSTGSSASSASSKTSAGNSGKGGASQKSETTSSADESQNGADKSDRGGAQGGDSVKIERRDQQHAGIAIASVEVRTIPRMLTVAGQVQMDEQHTSHIGALADGRVTAVYVLPGAAVHRGATLGGLHSHLVHETVGALVRAYAALDRQHAAVTFAQQARDRYSHLYGIQAASLEESQRSDQNLLQAKNQLIDAEADVRMEREHLSELLQVPPESLTPDRLYDREIVPIRSAIDGVVIARNVTVGQVVPTGFEAFVVSNLSTVWVTAAVNERDLSMVRIGASSVIQTQGNPDHVFHGRVAMVGDTLDAQTRTVPVRIVVPNPHTQLRPGMFASAQIAGPQTRSAIFVPEDAMQDINGLKVVFVTPDGITFRAQTVSVGTRSEGKVEILDGLHAGDKLVVAGAFMVKSEMLKGTMGEG